MQTTKVPATGLSKLHPSQACRSSRPTEQNRKTNYNRNNPHTHENESSAIDFRKRCESMMIPIIHV